MQVRFAGRTLLVPTLLLLAACGGGSDGDDGGSPPPDAAVGGWWLGSIRVSGEAAVDLVGLVAENGEAYFVADDGLMYWGTADSSGNNLSATLEGAGLFGAPLADGSPKGTGTATGTLRARDSITANATFTTSLGSRTTSTIALDFDSLYEVDSSFATVAGNYDDGLGLYAGILNVAANGDLFLQEPGSGCIINGRLAIINAAYNAYDIQFTYSSCTGVDAVLNGATFNGLASYDTAFDQLLAFSVGTVSGNPFPNVFLFNRR